MFTTTHQLKWPINKYTFVCAEEHSNGRILSTMRGDGTPMIFLSFSYAEG